MNVLNKNTVSRRQVTCLTAAVASAMMMLAATPTIANETLVPVAQITLPGGQKITSFDISYVNPQLGIYVLGDRTSKAVDVVNTKTNTLLFQAGQGLFVGASPKGNNFSGPDGVVIVYNKELWVGDGDSTMKVLSLFDGHLAFTMSTGGTTRVDEMCYDPVDAIIMAANNAETPPFGTIFSARTKTILGKLTFDGKNGTFASTNGAEQCQWSPRTGKFYITIPEVNPNYPNPPPADAGSNIYPGGVLQIDPVSMKVTGAVLIPIKNCSGPQGMAIGPGSQILIGCNGGPNSAANGDPVVVIDDGSGAAFGTILATIPNQVGADMVDYNSTLSHYTLAKSAAPGPQAIGVIDANNFTSDPDVTTGVHGGGGNHSIASDPVTNQYYLPVASTSGSKLCSSVGGVDSQGCILVLKPSGTDSDEVASAPTCPAQGTPVVNVAGFSPNVLTSVCR
jgi:hypothetical protein